MQQKLANSLDFYDDYTRACQQNLLLRVLSSKPFIVEDLIAAHARKSPRITFRPNRRSAESEAARQFALDLPEGTAFLAKVYLDVDYKKSKGLEKNSLWTCFLLGKPDIVFDWLNLIVVYFGSKQNGAKPQVEPQLVPQQHKVSPQVGLQVSPPAGTPAGTPVGPAAGPQAGLEVASPPVYKRRAQQVPQVVPPVYQPGAQLGFQPGTSSGVQPVPDVWTELQQMKLRMSAQDQKIADLERINNEQDREIKRLNSKLRGVNTLIERRTEDMKEWVHGQLEK